MGLPKKNTNFCMHLRHTLALILVSALHNKLKTTVEDAAKPTEEQLQKQLTVVSVIYHLIGILYNE